MDTLTEKQKFNKYHNDYYHKHKINIKCEICGKNTTNYKLKVHQKSQKCRLKFLEKNL